MSKYKIFIGVLLLLPGILFAQADPFLPPTPVAVGQGGAFTANAEGMNAFFYNPAGFARDGEFTLLSVTPWAFMDKSLLDFLIKTFDLASGEEPAGSVSRQLDPGTLEQFGLSEDDLTGLEDIAAWGGKLTPEQQEAAVKSVAESEDLKTQLKDAGLPEDTFSKLLEDPSGEISDEALSEILVTVLSNPTIMTTALEAASDGAESEGADELDTSSAQALADKLDPAKNPKIPSGNLRAGAQVALGYVGHGFGLGAFVTADAQFRGKNLFGTKGRILNTVTLAAGLAFPIGPITLGAQVRPTFMGYSNVNPSSLISSLSGGGEPDLQALIGDVYTGFRIGVDVGALWDIGPFTLGAAIKDILPFKLQQATKYTGEEYLSLLTAGELPLNTGAPVPDEELYDVPPFKLNVGASFHPDLGALSVLFDPRISVDVRDLIGIIRAGNDDAYLDPTVWDFLNIGAEVKILRFASFRAGMYDGYLTAGVGAHLLFLDINAAIAVSGLNTDLEPVQFKNIGFTLETAIRF